MGAFDKLAQEYYLLLEQQPFQAHLLDDQYVEKQRPFLDSLSRVGNSGITVFDLYRKEHVYTSYNFESLFGYDLQEINQAGNAYFDSKVHPEDLLQLMKHGISMLRYTYQLPPEERMEIKLINEYRILGRSGEYQRVIEQQQAFALDPLGNLWLALGVIDLSPDQRPLDGVKTQLLNFRTGTTTSASQQGHPVSRHPSPVDQSRKGGAFADQAG